MWLRLRLQPCFCTKTTRDTFDLMVFPLLQIFDFCFLYLMMTDKNESKSWISVTKYKLRCMKLTNLMNIISREVWWGKNIKSSSLCNNYQWTRINQSHYIFMYKILRNSIQFVRSHSLFLITYKYVFMKSKFNRYNQMIVIKKIL